MRRSTPTLAEVYRRALPTIANPVVRQAFAMFAPQIEQLERQAATGGHSVIALRRKLADGRLLEGEALEVYIPRRRGARHYADAFSQALYLAKICPDEGQQLAWDLAHSLAAITPAEVDLLTCPPASRKRMAAGFYLARELTVAVCDALTDSREVHVARPLRWQQENIIGAGAAKQIMYQGGQGRKLGRVVECLEDLRGRVVVIVDDLFTTGATAAVTAEALIRAGASKVCLATVGATERTEHRPADERERVKWRGEVRAAKRHLTG